MAGLRCLFDHPRLLADDSSLCRAVARAAALAIFGAIAGVGGNVGRSRAGHSPLAGHLALSNRLDVERGGSAVRWRIVRLFAIGKGFQRNPTWRPARSSRRQPRAAVGNGWHQIESAASSVPSASVRNASVERRDRARGVLGADGVRCGYRSGDDPNGGCGVGEEVWKGVRCLP